MNEASKSAFNFQGFKIVRSVIDWKEGELKRDFHITFEPSGIHFVKLNQFQLNLNTIIENDSQLLHIEVDAIATYNFKEGENPEVLSNFFFINAPAILFPYIRAYVSALTTLSGMAPVTIPALNLTNLAADLQANTQRVEE